MILYGILYAVSYTLSLLPLRGLYLLSDLVLYPLIRYVLRYRVSLVRNNIIASFPEKDAMWIRHTVNSFYHYLCDECVECIKMMSISEEEMRRRMRFENIEVLQAYLDRGKSVALYLGHLGNWDWVTSMTLWLHGYYAPGQIYHVLENKTIDRLFLKIRSRWKGECIPMAETLRRLAHFRTEGRPWIIGFIADQVPFWNNIHHWLTLLGHKDTPVLTGTERIARRFAAAAMYIDIRRERRGYYVAHFVSLTDDCSKHKDWEVTDMFFSALEDNIRRVPHLWLWTHNRWKRTREEYNRRWDEETQHLNIS